MKIAYVLGEYPSVSETFIAREIEALRRCGFEIDIWALQAGEGARQIPPLFRLRWRGKVKTFHAHQISPDSFKANGTRWARRERERMENIQHIHAGWASHPAFIAWGAAEVLGVPWSFSAHARDLWVEGKALDAKLRAAKFASCCTRAGTRYLQSLAPDVSRKVLYAPHGIELGRYKFQERNRLQDVIEVMAVGRLVEKKGFPIFMLAFCTLVESGYRMSASIIGEGPQRRELEKQIATIKWGDEFRLVGAYSHQQVIAVMKRADLFIMPSVQAADGDRDGLPNVLLEAAACSLPIVSTRAGSITDFLDEDCAWLCAPNDANALAQAMENAIKNYDESLRRARNARKRVEEKFDIEKNIGTLARAFTASS